jgi:rod shape-determining protein MreC
MRNLFLFVWRNNFAFLFLLLEVLSFSLIFTYNNYPKAAYFRFSQEVNGRVHYVTSSISSYIHLRDINRQLAIENSILRSGGSGSWLKTDTISFWKNDTLYRQQYRFMQAGVVSNSVNKRNNFLMLNKGSNQGVKIDMGIMGPKGVVGIVVGVSQNFSTVMSVLHNASVVSAIVKKNEQLGSVTWEGGSYSRAKLNNISGQVKIAAGDTVVTSGFSLIYPKGICIGTIEKFKLNTDDNYYDITIKLSTDFNSLGHVYIVNNIYRKEQDALIEQEKKITQEKK